MRAAAASFFFITCSAVAQVAATDHSDPSRGATLFPGSVASAGHAEASKYNPAGLNKVSTVELLYAHERSFTRDRIIDGLYLALAPTDSIGLGFSIEWLRDARYTTGNRRSTFTLALGGEALSFGANLNLFYGGPVDLLTSVDLGVQSRFSRWVAVGAQVRNVDAPSRPTVALPRTWVFGLSLRPFGEKLTLSTDWEFAEPSGPFASRLAYTAQGEMFRGFNLYAGVSHGFRSVDPLFFQFGLMMDVGTFGAGYAVSGSSEALNHLFVARLSADPRRALPIFSDKIAVLGIHNLGETQSSGGTLGSLLGATAPDRYLSTLRFLQRAEKDPDLKGLVLKIESSDLRFGRAVELHDAILKLRGAGKKVVAIILTADDADYLIAAAAEHVYAVPEAMLAVDGLSTNIVFLGGTAQKLGVTVDVARVGAYKNAPDQFTRTEMSAEQREAIEAYLDVDVAQLESRITQARGITAEQWKTAVDEGLKSTRRAQALKLIDDVLTAPQLQERLGTLIPGARLDPDYRARAPVSERWGTPRKLAVIPVIGDIGGGANKTDPILDGQTAGADTFIRSLDAASRDSDVAAIVLRIDSPGGDGLASDMMYRAVLEAKKRKPVVASMGDVAASGGYYVAMGADQIFASPTTITGSIGVFFIKPGVQELAEKLGATQQSLRRGAAPSTFDWFTPWDDVHRASAQRWVDDFYDTFITEAALSRKKTKEEIDAVARGRVWAGSQALEKGLVDQLGGLGEALEAARVRGGLGANEDFEVVLYGGNKGLVEAALGAGVIGESIAGLSLATPTPTTPKLLQRLTKDLGAATAFEGAPIQARLEYLLEVR